MRELHSISAWHSSMIFVSAGCAALTALLFSCSAELPAQREDQRAKDSVLAVPYSIVCVIHGDGDYLYHDTSGHEYKADEEALKATKRVAQQNPTAEVFIFHQKPRRHFFFLFPLRDGEFYYYRSGRLIANEQYWRDKETSHFGSEVELYRRFRADRQRAMVNMFVYCGHDIPEFGGASYDASYPHRTFNVHDFADGVKAVAPDSAKFDLLLLSTCYGGTPYTIGALRSSARYVIASPDNLHLSYFDLHSLERLDISLQDGNVSAFAKRYARQAFDRLAQDIQTAVSVAVYDVDRVQEFLQSVHNDYDSTLAILKGETQTSAAMYDHCDCADLPAYVLPTMSNGVDVFYRPARFGRSKHKQNHSGWECWKKRGSQAETVQNSDPVQDKNE